MMEEFMKTQVKLFFLAFLISGIVGLAFSYSQNFNKSLEGMGVEFIEYTVPINATKGTANKFTRLMTNEPFESFVELTTNYGARVMVTEPEIRADQRALVYPYYAVINGGLYRSTWEVLTSTYYDRPFVVVYKIVSFTEYGTTGQITSLADVVIPVQYWLSLGALCVLLVINLWSLFSVRKN
jgi:hypothetical protein